MLCAIKCMDGRSQARHASGNDVTKRASAGALAWTVFRSWR